MSERTALVIRIAANVAELRKNLAEGTSAITTTTAAMGKLASSLDGSKLEQRAHNIVAAMNKIGGEGGVAAGALKLTDAEAKRLAVSLDAAIDKAKRMGKELPADIHKAREALERTGDSAGKANKFFGDLGTQVKATALGFIGAQAVIAGVQAGFRALTQFVGDSIESFAAAEAAQKKLTTALRSQGADVPRVASQYNKLAAEFQRTTVYSDDLVTEMQALLVQVGGVAPREMKKALTAATDLATGLGIDLQAATLLVGKAFAGETGTLKRYGIVVDEAKLKAEGITAVLDAIHERFGGQAQAEIETYAGKMKQLENAWDDFQESVGRAIVEDALLKASLTRTANGIDDVNAKAQEGHSTVTEWWSRLAGAHEVAEVIRYLNIVSNLQQRVNDQMRAMQSSVKVPGLFEPDASAQKVGFDVGAYLKGQEVALKATEAAAKKYAESLNRMAAARIPLTKEQQKSVDLYIKEGQSLKDIATVLKVSEVAIKNYTDAHKRAQKAIDDHAKVTAKLDQAFRDFSDARAEATLKRIVDEALKGIQAIRGMFAVVATLDQAFRDFSDARAEADWQRMVDEALRKHEEAVRKAEQAYRDWMGLLDGLSGLFFDLAGNSNSATASFLRDVSLIIDGYMMASEAARAYEEAAKKGSEAGQAAALIGGAQAVWQAAGAKNRKAATLGAAAAGAKMGMVAGPYGAAVGAVVGGIVGFIRSGGQGREAVEEFANAQGGFDALHAKLQKLGAEGERLWIRLTQGVGKNNPEQAAAAITAITTALTAQEEQIQRAANAASKYGLAFEKLGAAEQAKRFSAQAGELAKDFEALTKVFGVSRSDALSAMAEEINALIDLAAKAGIQIPASMQPLVNEFIGLGLRVSETTKKLQDELKALAEKRDGLMASIANEAPEEVMGVIEAETRARIAAIESEMEAKQAEIDRATAAAKTAADQAATEAMTRADEIDAHFRDTFSKPYIIKFEYDIPDFPNMTAPTPVTPMADGGFGTVTKPTLFLAGEAGPEQFAFSGAGRTFGGGGFGGKQEIVIHNHTYLDGRHLTETVSRHLTN